VSADALRRRAGVYIQPTTLQIVELSVQNGALIQGRQGGPTLTPVAENRFRTQGQAAEIVFADGERAGFERRVDGVRPVPFEWRQPDAHEGDAQQFRRSVHQR
jgi:hypothetical protein